LFVAIRRCAQADSVWRCGLKSQESFSSDILHFGVLISQQRTKKKKEATVESATDGPHKLDLLLNNVEVFHCVIIGLGYVLLIQTTTTTHTTRPTTNILPKPTVPINIGPTCALPLTETIKGIIQAV
jgi:hypothetical protein